MKTPTWSKRKTMSFVALVAAAGLGLSACGGGKAAEPTESADAPSKDAAETVEIAYLHRLPDGDGMTPVADVVAKWNEENPDIKVTATKFDGKANEMIKKLETDIKADNAPCLAQLGYAEVPELYTKGLVEDVTAEAEKYKGDFAPGAYSLMTVAGKAVGLPQDTGPLVYFYDKAAFEALGLKVPTTLDEFKNMAKEAAAQGKYIAAFEPDEAQMWLSGQAAAAGDVWYTAQADNWKVETNGAGSKVVADFWQELLDSNAALNLNRWDDAYTKALKDGQLIGNIGAAWEAGFMLDGIVAEDAQGTWAVTQLPDFGKGVMTGPDGGSGVAVMKGCKYPEQAMKFNAWFNTQIDPLASQGLVVAAKGTVATPEKIKRQFGGQDVAAELAKANDNMNPNFVYMPGFSAVGPEMAKAAANVATGGKVMDIFEAAQKTSVDTLKSMNLPVAAE
ncbi:MAG: extracellular solute-binding protein [Actinomycetaceae bacterium]|nr:extracellular solute-binding protein [Actinomycetaceae bacterium]